MAGMDPGALDRYITGNYGEDQYPDFECPGCEDDENAAHVLPCDLAEDDRDYDSMPGGWDYEDDPQAEYDDYWGDPLDVPSYGD
jgi:hypothetical protein